MDRDGLKPLHCAARLGQVDVVVRMCGTAVKADNTLEQQMDEAMVIIDEGDDDGVAQGGGGALGFLNCSGPKKLALSETKKLTAKDAKAYVCGEQSKPISPLLLAIESQQLSVVEFLVNGVDGVDVNKCIDVQTGDKP